MCQIIVVGLSWVLAFFALFLYLQPGRAFKDTGLLLSAGFAVLLIYNVVSTIARIRKSQPLKGVSISATIFLEGQILIRIQVNIFIFGVFRWPSFETFRPFPFKIFVGDVDARNHRKGLSGIDRGMVAQEQG